MVAVLPSLAKMAAENLLCLKILQGSIESTSGDIKIPDNVRIGYVPQVIERFEDLSGGQRLNKAFTQALTVDPNIFAAG